MVINMGSIMKLGKGHSGIARRLSLQIGLLVLAMILPIAIYAAEPVCAKVKIEIHQELTLERQAFDAMMRITNSLDNIAIENVTINVNFKDENGASILATSDPENTAANRAYKVSKRS